MRTFLLIATATAATLVSGCSGISPGAQGVMQIACTFDQLAPGGIATVGAIATIADPTFAATAAQMTEADRLAHPLAQAACAAIPGTPQPLVVAAPGVSAPLPGTPIMLSPTATPIVAK